MATMLPQDVRTIAVVGCTKNAGKTTTLNVLLASLGDRSPHAGVLSIGIDGEEADFWLGVPKPRVEVRAGDWVATAEAALAAGSARIDLLERTGGRTLLGDLVVGRVREAGSVLLAGIRSKEDVRAAVESLRRRGAGRVLVDGAYQRIVAADPEISDGVIVATGAVLGPTVTEVAERTREFLSRLQVPATDRADDLELMAAARAAGRPAVRCGLADARTLVPDSLDSAEAARALAAGDATVAIPGAVTDDVLHRCTTAVSGRLRLVAQDPTRLFLSPPEATAFQRRHELRVVRPIRVLAVTVNPFSVLGWTLSKAGLEEAVRAVAGGLPVVAFDLLPVPG